MKNRTLTYIIISAAVAIVAVLTPYFVHFRTGQLSYSPEVWAAFGSYVGGLLGPALAFLGLLALLLTIRLQDATARVTKETARFQQEYLHRKERKEEWLSIIQHAETHIHKHLDSPVYKAGVRVGMLAEALNFVSKEMTEAGRIHKNDRPFADELLKKTFDNVQADSFGPVHSLMVSLGVYLDQLSKFLVEDDGEILSHYVSSYIGFLARLEQTGIVRVGGASQFGELTVRHSARRARSASQAGGNKT